MELAKYFKNRLKYNEPMKKHCSFKSGGSAEIFVEPKNLEEIQLLLNWIKQNNVPLFVLGGGTNIIVKDNGISGVVLSLKKLEKKISFSKENQKVILRSSSNIHTSYLCNYAIKNNLKGLNFALGIPGQIGGAICVNASTRYGDFQSILNKVVVINENGKIQSSKTYEKGIILEIELILEEGNKLLLEKEKKEILEARKKSQDLKFPSAGCIFQNPKNHSFGAGKLIDLTGLKGFKVGGAKVSNIHANFIVNENNASSEDI